MPPCIAHVKSLHISCRPLAINFTVPLSTQPEPWLGGIEGDGCHPACKTLCNLAALSRWPEPAEHGPREEGLQFWLVAHSLISGGKAVHAGGLSQSLAGEMEGKPLAIKTDAKRLAQEDKGAPTTPITPAGQDCHTLCCHTLAAANWAVMKPVLSAAAAAAAVGTRGCLGILCVGAVLLLVRPAAILSAAGL